MRIRNRHTNKLRLQLAHVAAKYVAVDGVTDYSVAKQKAALQLGINANKDMPTHHEVEQALIDYQRLFQNNSQAEYVNKLRNTAANAMRLMHEFRPLLVGPVLTGTATKASAVTLHIFCDELEKIGFFLDGRGIPFKGLEKKIRFGNSEPVDYPAISFFAEDILILLVVFPLSRRNITPICPVKEKPMQRANLADVETMLLTS